MTKLYQIEYLKKNILFRLSCIQNSINKISENIQQIRGILNKEGIFQSKPEVDFILEEIKIESI